MPQLPGSCKVKTVSYTDGRKKTVPLRKFGVTSARNPCLSQRPAPGIENKVTTPRRSFCEPSAERTRGRRGRHVFAAQEPWAPTMWRQEPLQPCAPCIPGASLGKQLLLFPLFRQGTRRPRTHIVYSVIWRIKPVQARDRY